MRNTRLPVSLNESTCTITDTASSTNSPPTTASTISCLVATAIAPIIPPSASDPVSPMKIEAGGALNHRNPKPAPITAPHSTPRSPGAGAEGVFGECAEKELPGREGVNPKHHAA